jgi:hypothetical protein
MFWPRPDTAYLESIRSSFLNASFEDALFFTADPFGWENYDGGLRDVLQMANSLDPDVSFAALQRVQPLMPLMIVEFYPGKIKIKPFTFLISHDP